MPLLRLFRLKNSLYIDSTSEKTALKLQFNAGRINRQIASALPEMKNDGTANGEDADNEQYVPFLHDMKPSATSFYHGPSPTVNLEKGMDMRLEGPKSARSASCIRRALR